MNNKITDIFFNLWYSPKRYLKDTIIAAKRIIFLFKHGYPPQATWETYAWFTCVMKDILNEYKKYHCGYPSKYSSDEEWEKEIDLAISYLEIMDENNLIYDDMSIEQQESKQAAAKDKFMKWFTEHFYNLWD